MNKVKHPKKPCTFRLTEEAIALIDRKARELGVSQAAIIEMAVREFVKK